MRRRIAVRLMLARDIVTAMVVRSGKGTHPILIALTACVASTSLMSCKTSDADLALQRQIEESVPHCLSERQCDVMWEAAQGFVRQHGSSADERYDPNRGATSQANMNTSQILMSARQTPTASGYRFEFHGRCLNLFRCRPSVLKEHLRFNRFVKASGQIFEPLELER